MAIVTKKLPYEILLRFSEGAEHQVANAGEFEGAHYIERTRLVDEDTGDIVGTPKGHEQDVAVSLPREKALEFFGENFAAFEEAHRTLQAAYTDLTKVRDELAQKNHALEAQLAATEARLTAVQQKLAAAAAALG